MAVSLMRSIDRISFVHTEENKLGMVMGCDATYLSSYFLNRCVPRIMEPENVTSIHNKEQCITNYRPISLLPCVQLSMIFFLSWEGKLKVDVDNRKEQLNKLLLMYNNLSC